MEVESRLFAVDTRPWLAPGQAVDFCKSTTEESSRRFSQLDVPSLPLLLRVREVGPEMAAARLPAQQRRLHDQARRVDHVLLFCRAVGEAGANLVEQHEA